MDEQRLRQLLAGLPIPALRYFEQTGSTNDDALGWIEEGARDSSLVAADLQTAGRGRLGRRWVTEAGAALAFSVILRPAAWEVERLGLISPLGALAVATALEKRFQLAPEIKWPNDVLVGRRKLCGILLEASWMGEQLLGVVVGIGVNVARRAVPPPETVLFPATSLEDVLGACPERESLLADVLEAFFFWRARIASLEFLQAWEQRLAFRGEMVTVSQGGGSPVSGALLGVTAKGDLRLRTVAGEEVHLNAGDVHLRPLDEQ